MNSEYNYPKSLVDNYMCETKNYKDDLAGNHTNMSIPDCITPELYQCYNVKEFRNSVGPVTHQNYTMLNPDAIKNKYSTEFQPIACEKAPYQGCPPLQYASPDPRLISAVRGGDVLTLDRPPIQSSMKTSEIINDKSLNKYGQQYSGYEDINAGQILYYVDKHFIDPFYMPIFSTSANVQGVLYQDPMGSMKPHYIRTPLKCSNPVTEKFNYDGELSWIHDSTNHREDLLSRQMSKMNQQRFEPRWYK